MLAAVWDLLCFSFICMHTYMFFREYFHIIQFLFGHVYVCIQLYQEFFHCDVSVQFKHFGWVLLTIFSLFIYYYFILSSEQ